MSATSITQARGPGGHPCVDEALTSNFMHG